MAARLSATLLRTQADRRLTTLAAGGSEPAFEALVERYRRPLQTYCRRLLLDSATAEDVVQQAFLSTWQTLRSGTAIADVKPWLYRVAHNGAINALKRSGYRHEELDDALSGAEAPEDDLERRIAVRRTLAGLASLPELQREALLRTAVEGRSHEQVARELGLTDGAVRGLVYRARATLRAAATAVTPAPVVHWVASWTGRESAPMAERIGDLVAGGGSAGAAAFLLKGSATVVATGALAGGAVVAERDARRDSGGGATPAAAEAAERQAPRRGAAAPRPARLAVGAALSGDDVQRTESRSRTRSRTGRRGRDRDREEDAGDRRPATVDDRDDDRSGPGSGDDDRLEAEDHSGPGGGDDDETSDGDGRLESSGPGSDDDVLEAAPVITDSSGSDSSGSGSSESGSTEVERDLSGSGSSGSSDDEPDDLR